MIKLRLLWWENFLWLWEWAQFNFKDPYKREAKSQSQRRRYDERIGRWMMWGHEPRSTGHLQELGEPSPQQETASRQENQDVSPTNTTTELCHNQKGLQERPGPRERATAQHRTAAARARAEATPGPLTQRLWDNNGYHFKLLNVQ